MRRELDSLARTDSPLLSMPNAVEARIKDRISSFVTELDKLVRQSALEAVRGVLDTGGMATRRGRPVGSGRPMGTAGRGPGRPRGSTSAKVQEVAQAIQAHVASNDGQSVSEIAAAVGAPLPVAKKAVAQLLADGGISKSGERRGTKYHAGGGSPSSASTASRGKRAGKKRRRKAK